MARTSMMFVVPVTSVRLDTGATADVPDLGLAKLTWSGTALHLHTTIAGEVIAFSKLSSDVGRGLEVYAVIGEAGILSRLAHLGTDARKVADWYADRTPDGRAKARTYGLKDNAAGDGFDAPKVFAGDVVDALGRDEG